jgi:hypothetical protein
MEYLIGIVVGLIIALIGKPVIKTATTGKVSEGKKATKQVDTLATKADKALGFVTKILDDAIEIDKKSTEVVQSIKSKIDALKH